LKCAFSSKRHINGKSEGDRNHSISNLAHKLRQIYLLHADLKGAYYLLFKAILKLKSYPTAYQTAIRYRRWLKNEIFCLLMETKSCLLCKKGNFYIYDRWTILGF
jgi:hypothetical protein